jgi:hypothetical protein
MVEEPSRKLIMIIITPAAPVHVLYQKTHVGVLVQASRYYVHDGQSRPTGDTDKVTNDDSRGGGGKVGYGTVPRGALTLAGKGHSQCPTVSGSRNGQQRPVCYLLTRSLPWSVASSPLAAEQRGCSQSTHTLVVDQIYQLSCHNSQPGKLQSHTRRHVVEVQVSKSKCRTQPAGQERREPATATATSTARRGRHANAESERAFKKTPSRRWTRHLPRRPPAGFFPGLAFFWKKQPIARDGEEKERERGERELGVVVVHEARAARSSSSSSPP